MEAVSPRKKSATALEWSVAQEREKNSEITLAYCVWEKIPFNGKNQWDFWEGQWDISKMSNIPVQELGIGRHFAWKPDQQTDYFLDYVLTNNQWSQEFQIKPVTGDFRQLFRISFLAVFSKF